MLKRFIKAVKDTELDTRIDITLKSYLILWALFNSILWITIMGYKKLVDLKLKFIKRVNILRFNMINE